MNKLFALLVFFAVSTWTITSCSAPTTEESTEQTEQSEASGGEAAGHEHADGHDHGHDHSDGASQDGPEYTSAYICPMHCPGSGSDQPGTCPACGMDYVANPNANAAEQAPAEAESPSGDNG